MKLNQVNPGMKRKERGNLSGNGKRSRSTINQMPGMERQKSGCPDSILSPNPGSPFSAHFLICLCRQNKRPHPAGFTVVELLVVMTIILLLAAMLMPVLSKAQMRSKQASCLSQLKQIGLAHHAYAHDHNSRFPAQVPIREGGTREYYYEGTKLSDEFHVEARHWQVLSNELVTAKIVRCPSDKLQPVGSFGELNNEHLSYFVGLKAQFGEANSILAGDRNLEHLQNSPAGLSGRTTEPMRWTRDLHQWRGNLLFADGRAESLNNTDLGIALASNKILPPSPVASTPVTLSPSPNTPNTPSAPPGSGPEFDSAAYAQKKLFEFFNDRKSPPNKSSSNGFSTPEFVYIEKDFPSRLLGTTDPMVITSNKSPSALSPSGSIVYTNPTSQTVVTQVVKSSPVTNQTTLTNTVVIAEVIPPQGWNWGWLIFMVLALGFWWVWRLRKPRQVEDAEE